MAGSATGHNSRSNWSSQKSSWCRLVKSSYTRAVGKANLAQSLRRASSSMKSMVKCNSRTGQSGTGRATLRSSHCWRTYQRL